MQMYKTGGEERRSDHKEQAEKPTRRRRKHDKTLFSVTDRPTESQQLINERIALPTRKDKSYQQEEKHRR